MCTVNVDNMYLPFYQRDAVDTNEAEEDGDEIDRELDANIAEYNKHQMSVTENKLAGHAGQLIRDDGEESVTKNEDNAPPFPGDDGGNDFGVDNENYQNPYRYLRY